MRKFSLATLILFSVTWTSCGPNAAELAQQQQHRDDSIKKAAILETTRQFESKEAIAREIRDVNATLNSLLSEGERASADLDVALDKMKNIKEFHFGRSESERDEQIRSQALIINELRDKINAIKASMVENEGKLGKLKDQASNSQ